jgi:cell wall-associated NlpC family hydrolase
LDDNAFIGTTFRDALQYRVGVSLGLGGQLRRNTKSAPRVVRRVRLPDAVPAPAPAPAAPPAAAARPRTVTGPLLAIDMDTIAPRLIDAADGFLGTPWRDGGTSAENGFDAGGFIQTLFAEQGIQLPRLVRDLARTGSAVSTRVGALQAGDLVLFSSDGFTPDHVAMYVGRDQIVHASASGGGVVYDVLGEGARGRWFAAHLLTVRRVIGTRRENTSLSAPNVQPSGRPDSAPRPAGVP